MYVSNVRTEDYWEIVCIVGWERWERKIMGLTNSPYHTCQEVTWSKTIVLGYRRESSDTFIWEGVVVNFLGSEVYD